MSGPAARALAEWQALRFETMAAQLRISGVPLEARVNAVTVDVHWWETERRRVADAFRTLERLFASTDDDLHMAYEAEREAERRKAWEAARPTPSESTK